MLKNKQKIQITLDADKVTNQKKINIIRYEALKLKYTNDTSTVVLVILTDDIIYSEFVSLLDICMMDQHKKIAAFDDKFVIYGEIPPAKIKETGITFFNCGYVPFKRPPQKLSFTEQRFNDMKKRFVKD